MWVYSLGYNSYVFIDAAVCVAVGALLLSVKPFVKQVRTVQAAATIKAKAEEAPAE